MTHRTRLCALALTALLTLTPTTAACAGPGPAPDPTTAPAPSARATSPAELCTAIITKWARQLYEARDSTYGDYQSMGLSNGQYTILRDILDTARAERGAASEAAGRELIDRQARERRAERHQGGGPSGGPWV
ncbi:hypothetical protein [Streptomyces sp. NRRL S-1521]|uniref:hypothetical protein n=1 Tax=Streptomyces sp. NRRL S-1521 TaxID=1609100 RepID=UPI00074B22C0|nr:hypothetical protein [Streptomyces sp. NRRL S-1521]KUL51061.1 hypothetical protein ADL30_28285 [Streptomyces sp. NRRL S-1521]